MANPDTPGVDTSEHAAMKQAQIWIRFACTLLATIATALLATGVIPDNSTWIGILTMVASVAGLIAGEVKTAGNYTQARTALKIAKVGGGVNPSLASTFSAALPQPPPLDTGRSTSG